MYKLTEIDQLLIEKKLDNTLTNSELTQFNQRLTDADFAAELKRYETAIGAIKAFGDNKLKALLQQEEAALQQQTDLKLTAKSTTIDAAKTEMPKIEPPQYKAPKMRSLAQRWAIAASLLLLVSATALYFINKNKEEKPQTAALKFKPYRNYERPTVRDNAHKDIVEKAFSLYDNGEYEAALTYFERIPLSVSSEQTPQYNVLFLQANAYLATNQAEKAVPILTQLSQAKDAEQQQKAEWFLALALSEKQGDKARLLFQKIKDTPNHIYQKQAADRLN